MASPVAIGSFKMQFPSLMVTFRHRCIVHVPFSRSMHLPGSHVRVKISVVIRLAKLPSRCLAVVFQTSNRSESCIPQDERTIEVLSPVDADLMVRRAKHVNGCLVDHFYLEKVWLPFRDRFGVAWCGFQFLPAMDGEYWPRLGGKKAPARLSVSPCRAQAATSMRSSTPVFTSSPRRPHLVVDLARRCASLVYIAVLQLAMLDLVITVSCGKAPLFVAAFHSWYGVAALV